MRKKLIVITAAIIFLFACAFTISVNAEEITTIETGAIGPSATYTLTSDGILTISGTGNTYNYDPTGNYFSPLGYLSDQITSVVIKTGIENIGSNLFNSVDQMVSVSIPNSVTSIGSYAFMHCSSLGAVKIPASVTSIGSYAFYNSGITEISVPASVTYIGGYAFDECPNLEVVPGVLDENIRFILNKTTGEFRFSGTGAMPGYDVVNNNYAPYRTLSSFVKSIVIEEGITSVGSCAFWQFGEVESVQLPSTITAIYSSAFQQNYKLKEIDIPDGVTYIGQQAFDGCTVMEDITLPPVLETIGMYAFRDCNALTEVVVPESVTSVKDYAFQVCTSLEKVEWNCDASIPSNAFANCPKLKEVHLNGAPYQIGRYAFSDCTSLASIVLPEGVKVIGDYAFGNNTALTNIEIPDTVTTIGAAFSGCTSLASIDLPDSITSLGACVFNECTSLSEISIPSKVMKIGEKAFYNCQKLESMVIPNGVTAIGEYAFYGCLALSEIELPDTLTSIQKYAFLLCDKLKEIHILNASCTLENPSLPDGITVYGYDGSPAHDYALLYEYPFVSLGKSDIGCYTVRLSSTVYTYNGKAFTPGVTIDGLTEGVDYTVTYSDNKNAGTACVIVTGMGDFTGTNTATFKINPAYLNSNLNVEFMNGTSYTYTGSEICPQMIVTSKLDEEELVEGKDYTVTYEDNISKGTAQITFTGINNYYSTSYRSFTITAKPLEELNLTLAKTEYTYTGSVVYPEILDQEGNSYSGYSFGSVTFGDNVIDVGAASCTVKGSGNYTGSQTFEYTIVPKNLEDYGYYLKQTEYTYTGAEIKPYISKMNSGPSITPTVTYSNNIHAGTGKVTITSTGNVVGSVELPFTIVPKSINSYSISIPNYSYPYTGKAIEPKVTVSNLVEGTDYTVSYSDNIEVGYNNAKITVTGIGDYTGTISRTFIIYAKDISDCEFKLSQSSYSYDGSAKKPKVTADGMVEGKDYEVYYYNNTDAGTANIVIKGMGNYSGEATRTFTIKPMSASATKASLSFSKITYDGYSHSPVVTVKNAKGEELYEYSDYTLTYKNEYSQNVGRYYVKITFTKNYTGSKTLYYMILPKAPASASAVLYGYDDVKFTWKKSTGASGYNVYCKNPGESTFTYLGTTTNLYYKKANLLDGKKYTFKVVPYVKINDKKYESLKSKTYSIYTLKKISTPVITKVNAKTIKVKWTNINGESGYQISKTTSKTKTSIVSTYNTTSGSSKNLTVTKGKTYYYKVRAYKTVAGKKIYGPWSDVKKYKL